VNVGLITALREGGVEVVGLAIVVEGDSSDDDGLEAIAVRVQGTLLDGKSEATTSVLETSDEDPVLAVHGAAP